MLSASAGSFRSRYRSAFSMARGIDSAVIGFKSNMASPLSPRAEEPEELPERIVELVRHPFFERDDGVVGDRDGLGTDLRTALRDVAVADAVGVLEIARAALDVQRMHLESGHVNEKTGADELLVEMVLAKDVANVLAEEALDALAELLDTVDVGLRHPPRSVRRVRRPRT